MRVTTQYAPQDTMGNDKSPPVTIEMKTIGAGTLI